MADSLLDGMFPFLIPLAHLDSAGGTVPSAICGFVQAARWFDAPILLKTIPLLRDDFHLSEDHAQAAVMTFAKSIDPTAAWYRHRNISMMIGVVVDLDTGVPSGIALPADEASLYDVLQEGIVSPLHAIAICTDIARALACLHSQDPPIIHGVVSLKNVNIQKGAGRLVDPNMARFFHSLRGSSPGQMPEDDVRQVGTILSQLLTGQAWGDPIQDSIKQFPELEPLFERVCADDPDQRPNARELVGILVSVGADMSRKFKDNPGELLEKEKDSHDLPDVMAPSDMGKMMRSSRPVTTSAAAPICTYCRRLAKRDCINHMCRACCLRTGRPCAPHGSSTGTLSLDPPKSSRLPAPKMKPSTMPMEVHYHQPQPQHQQQQHIQQQQGPVMKKPRLEPPPPVEPMPEKRRGQVRVAASITSVWKIRVGYTTTVGELKEVIYQTVQIAPDKQQIALRRSGAQVVPLSDESTIEEVVSAEDFAGLQLSLLSSSVPVENLCWPEEVVGPEGNLVVSVISQWRVALWLSEETRVGRVRDMVQKIVGTDTVTIRHGHTTLLDDNLLLLQSGVQMNDTLHCQPESGVQAPVEMLQGPEDTMLADEDTAVPPPDMNNGELELQDHNEYVHEMDHHEMDHHEMDHYEQMGHLDEGHL